MGQSVVTFGFASTVCAWTQRSAADRLPRKDTPIVVAQIANEVQYRIIPPTIEMDMDLIGISCATNRVEFLGYVLGDEA